MEWRPIESAPKDRRAILGFADGDFTTVHWMDWSDGSGCWTLCVAGSFCDDGEWWPTHWMALPEAPVG